MIGLRSGLDLLILCTALLNETIHAHRSLPSGITCGPQFASPNDPLVIPNPLISWANYAILTCEDPIRWFEADATEGQELKFTVTVPVIDRFEDVRMSVVFLGPGLPTLSTNSSVPESITNYANNNDLGGTVFHSPSDQSSCEHLTSQEMVDATSVKEDRCHFYEPYGGSNLWVVLDNILLAPESGKYKIALYENNGTTAKASFACCDWPEDFLTAYDIPQTTCPACGSLPSNPAWSSLFYEHKSMAEYSGYPPLKICNDNSHPVELPSGDQCPPGDDSNGIDNIEQSESCKLGCDANGECHSHNVFGTCTHSIEWGLTPRIGEASVSKIIIFKGDKILFTAPEDTLVHNLYELSNEIALQQCNFEGSTPLANVEEISIGHAMYFNDPGLFYFTCGIGCEGSTFCHCSAGQKLAVEVKDATDGLRCHDHSIAKDVSAFVECGEGMVRARSVDNPSYGAQNDKECSEQCSPLIAIAFMTGVELGSCREIGFDQNPMTKTIRPEGSPMDIEVTVYSKREAGQNDCHCHSYEKIPCPAEVSRSFDILYIEHITEITTYCNGILDGSESDCPYKCFQPMEVLHLHYLECADRIVDPFYEIVNATNKCHIAAEAFDEVECPLVQLDTPSSGAPALLSLSIPISVTMMLYLLLI